MTRQSALCGYAIEIRSLATHILATRCEAQLRAKYLVFRNIHYHQFSLPANEGEDKNIAGFSDEYAPGRSKLAIFFLGYVGCSQMLQNIETSDNIKFLCNIKPITA